MGIINVLQGKRFGRLLVIDMAIHRKDRCVVWRCLCDCGRVKLVRGNSLVSGLTTSCGCLAKEKASERMTDDGNPMWRGDGASLGSLHSWVRKRKPKTTLCEICGETKPQDLSNISQEYKRDINDYQWVCRKCHMKNDKRMDARKLNGQFERVIKC